MSDEWFLNLLFLLGTTAYVLLLYRLATIAKYAFASRRWNFRDPPPPPKKEPSPHWRWAPWIVAAAGVLLLAGFLLIGSSVLEAIALSGISLIFGIQGIAAAYLVFRDDGLPPEA